jgi:hypothetical protein
MPLRHQDIRIRRRAVTLECMPPLDPLGIGGLNDGRSFFVHRGYGDKLPICAIEIHEINIFRKGLVPAVSVLLNVYFAATLGVRSVVQKPLDEYITNPLLRITPNLPLIFVEDLKGIVNNYATLAR